ncbi:TRAP transporter substrate-binding protein [Bhargavaea beijingensis]|uniref:DctP family TRAP transporter solute-binding subunit n=1 Tax=Bhargavaea beijingensis TaxID=426756 RepID=A0A1G7H3Y4_9BACL|nr:DctP family TRAP transporter solute-binding subunit [Bhargavaea beijingensis]MCW1927373.1 DctP family TRAP transporter solute-binding subunit [Bhargavaea beijingensis]RSK33734.1 DctP family TRAP transporter solute-binding subunit [Bhargavaea beijingensis]SDE95150.1 tripartite ATP-independent transporter solute receptor, DctP family [Bhargavaea beijingensis]
MKKWKVGLVAASLSVAMLVAGCSESDQVEADGESVKLQLGHAMSEGTPAADLIGEMAENVKEQTDGRVEFDVYPNSQLGSETEMIEQVQMGTMGSAAIMVGTMQSLDMKMAIEDLPYMWKDIDHARAAYDGEFGDYLADVMAEQNLKQIGYLEWGYRHITNNKKPIVKPEDMEGLKIRVAESSLRIDAFEQVGALPTAMAFSEVYGALQQGVLDAQENPLANIVAPKFDEVQDYLSLTGHFYNTVMLMVNNDTWEKISPEDQEIILKEAERISKEVRTQNDAMQEEYLNTLKERGMEINDDVDTAAFREAMLPVYEKWEKEHFGEELMDIYDEASGW